MSDRPPPAGASGGPPRGRPGTPYLLINAIRTTIIHMYIVCIYIYICIYTYIYIYHYIAVYGILTSLHITIILPTLARSTHIIYHIHTFQFKR